jgi:hypothetical protein
MSFELCFMHSIVDFVLSAGLIHLIVCVVWYVCFIIWLYLKYIKNAIYLSYF